MSIAVSIEGMHPTTESCLEALQWLHQQKDCKNVLDMGCGNGILSVAAASIWGASVLAVDIAPKAIEDTKSMATSYALDTLIRVERSDGFHNPLIKNNSPYDLILFNLLAEPIIAMAPMVKEHLCAQGHCILSGILAWEAEAVKNTYNALGVDFIKEYKGSTWHCYVACHKTDI